MAALHPAAHRDMPIRLVLAEPHPRMRRSLLTVLEREEQIELVGEAQDLSSLAHRMAEDRPDVVALDLGGTEYGGLAAVARLRERQPRTELVVLATDDSGVVARWARGAGALGFVATQFADEELAPAIRAAAHGVTYLSPRLAPPGAARPRPCGRPARSSPPLRAVKSPDETFTTGV
jgi:DNA-binding NarL/FixJ family response regulator